MSNWDPVRKTHRKEGGSGSTDRKAAKAVLTNIGDVRDAITSTGAGWYGATKSQLLGRMASLDGVSRPEGRKALESLLKAGKIEKKSGRYFVPPKGSKRK